MFAVAIYDNEAETLTLARDHFGIKPLYVANVAADDGAPHVVFGSEIKALLASGLVEAAPNDRVLYRYLRFRVHEDNNETFFGGIEKLQPGELMVIRPDGVERRMFTTLREDLMALAKQSKPYDSTQTEQFHKLLTEAINRRLVSEVPVGTALSGGLDSSTVVAVISKLMKQHARDVESVGATQNSFSAVFPGSVNDEERYVEAATLLTQINAQPYSQHDWHWRLSVAREFGHAAAPETVEGTLGVLDEQGIEGELALREVRVGRVEVTQMWGRPESVRQEFRRRRAQ